jgi:hypothetical protein
MLLILAHQTLSSKISLKQEFMYENGIMKPITIVKKGG